MRSRLFALAVALVAHACTVGDANDEYTDPAWDESQYQISPAAEVDDPAATEDVTDPPEATNDDADATEVDDIPPDLAPAVATATFQNPVASNCADPGVIRVD